MNVEKKKDQQGKISDVSDVSDVRDVRDVSDGSAWEVTGTVVDYGRFMSNCGAEPLQPLWQELRELAAKRDLELHLHPWLLREVYYCQRGLTQFLAAYKQDPSSVFLYTGRGPSNNMHLGHCLPFTMTCWLQRLFDCWLVIQMADEEKYVFRKQEKSFLSVYQLGYDNAEDIRKRRSSSRTQTIDCSVRHLKSSLPR